MNTAARNTLIITAAWLTACGSTFGGDKPSVGRKIGEFMRKADRRVQQELDRQPDIRKGITRGIDVFADNIIDAVEPNADEDARRFAKSGVQMMLNPSHSESDRAFSDMQNAIADKVAGNRGSGSAYRSRTSWSDSSLSNKGTYASHTHRARSTPKAGVALPPAILTLGQADWHRQLWIRADEGLLAASHSVSQFLPKAHAKIAGTLATTGLSPNAASTLATVAMGLTALFGLYLLLFFPRRRLKRQVRRLRQQLELERAKGVQA